jgi:hypothetical protein
MLDARATPWAWSGLCGARGRESECTPGAYVRAGAGDGLSLVNIPAMRPLCGLKSAQAALRATGTGYGDARSAPSTRGTGIARDAVAVAACSMQDRCRSVSTSRACSPGAVRAGSAVRAAGRGLGGGIGGAAKHWIHLGQEEYPGGRGTARHRAGSERERNA